MTGTSVGNIWWPLRSGWRRHSFVSAHAYRRQRQAYAAHITCRQLFMTVIPRSVRIVTRIFFARLLCVNFKWINCSWLSEIYNPGAGKVYFTLHFDSIVLFMGKCILFLRNSALHIVSWNGICCLLYPSHWDGTLIKGGGGCLQIRVQTNRVSISVCLLMARIHAFQF